MSASSNGKSGGKFEKYGAQRAASGSGFHGEKCRASVSYLTLSSPIVATTECQQKATIAGTAATRTAKPSARPKEKGRFAIGLSGEAGGDNYALTFESPVSRASSTGAGRSTSSTSAMGALSPWRKPNLRMRRYPPLRAL